jgi:hypothetical protein
LRALFRLVRLRSSGLRVILAGPARGLLALVEQGRFSLADGGVEPVEDVVGEGAVEEEAGLELERTFVERRRVPTPFCSSPIPTPSVIG